MIGFRFESLKHYGKGKGTKLFGLLLFIFNGILIVHEQCQQQNNYLDFLNPLDGWVFGTSIKNVVQSFKQDANKISIKHFGELAKQFRW